MVRGETKELIGGNNDQKKDECEGWNDNKRYLLGVGNGMKHAERFVMCVQE